jgi:rhamnosyltransferase
MVEFDEHKAKVAAIVVSYEPEPDLLKKNLQSIASQVDRVYLVDNSRAFQALPFCQDLRIPNLHSLILGDNYGIAVAINRGIREARSADMDFVFLLDQDSVAQDGTITTLLTGYRQACRQGAKVAAIGARAEDRTTGALSPALRFGYVGTRTQPCPEGGVARVDFLISSGTLIPLAVLEIVGSMREDLFIDYVDTEWILRAYSQGFATYLSCDARLIHAVGERRIRVWMGLWRNAPMHKPFRYYYLYRNYLLLLRQRGISRKWKIMESIRLLKMFLFILAFSHERREILGYIVKGVYDGIRNKKGKL